MREQGVRGVALTWIDNAGITRVKTVPVDRLDDAAAHGVGASPVFDVFGVDDSITTSPHIGGPVGDLRLRPDLERLTVLAGQPGWAWAPVDKWTQAGEPFEACQRTFARRMTARAAAAGLSLRMAFEIEWYCERASEPAAVGPAYGMTRVIELSDYLADLLAALDAQGVPVEQLHPEYAAGQMEVSISPADPVRAADDNVLVRQTIRAVAARHGLRVSFAPVVAPGQVGNGMHLHFSVDDLFSGGPGPHGLTTRGESVLAGLLQRLPALCAISAPSVSSYLRLVPQQWAAPFQCWGHENREAALRLVTGRSPNAEIKCCDGAANPYLVVGAVTALVVDALDAGLRLPPEVTVDPATLPAAPRLPTSLLEAASCLEADAGLRTVLGPALFEAILAVRRAEAVMFAGQPPEAVAAATRWRY